MADVLLSTSCLVGALGTYSIGMLRAELLSRKDEALFDGYRVYKVVHLKEKTLIGHEFFAVYLRKGITFIVVRIERRPGSPLGSSSDLWTDDSISRLNSNFDTRGYYNLSTTFCSPENPLTVLGMCDICAFIRHAAPFYSVTKQKHCYWFCAAFLIRLLDLKYGISLEKGKDYERQGCFAWKKIITEASVRKELTAGGTHPQKRRHVISLLQLFRPYFHPNLEQWELEWELKGHTRHVYSLCFTPDGKHILSGSSDGTIRTWDLSSGKDARRSLKGHSSRVNSVAVSPDGRHFVSASNDNTVRIWDLEAGVTASESSRGHDRPVKSVAFSPDGRKVVSGSSDGSLCIWDGETGAMIGDPLLLVGQSSGVRLVAWSPDGSRIISGLHDHTIRVWDAHTGTLLGDPLLGHTRAIISVGFSPDGSCFFSGSKDGTVRLWDTASRQLVGEPLRVNIRLADSAAFSPDGRSIAADYFDNLSVHILESTSSGPDGEKIRLDAGSRTYSVAWSPTGERIAAGCDDCMVRVWRKVCTQTANGPGVTISGTGLGH